MTRIGNGTGAPEPVAVVKRHPRAGGWEASEESLPTCRESWASMPRASISRSDSPRRVARAHSRNIQIGDDGHHSQREMADAGNRKCGGSCGNASKGSSRREQLGWSFTQRSLVDDILARHWHVSPWWIPFQESLSILSLSRSVPAASKATGAAIRRPLAHSPPPEEETKRRAKESAGPI